ncbi:hypothetical protein [Paenibacillus lautus]|uniref:hypothetical protein n=1 Tax=Paenibacillus lautus TaxID=1401 RepID=UPI0039868BDD
MENKDKKYSQQIKSIGLSDTMRKYIESSIRMDQLFTDNPLLETTRKIQQLSESMRITFDNPLLEVAKKLQEQNARYSSAFSDLSIQKQLFSIYENNKLTPAFKNLSQMNESLGKLLHNDYESYRASFVPETIYDQLNDLTETLPDPPAQEVVSNVYEDGGKEDDQNPSKITIGQVIMFLFALIQTFYPPYSDYLSNIQDSKREVIEDRQHSELIEKMDVLINSIQSQAVLDEPEVDEVGPHSQ